ncbi:MAG: hypothetical protein EA408_13375 [Marinilabiliales bacterium]|nr:MAG: hypothetical protein EA408_13375 [Marinilabiliales bacterium]
MELIYAHQVGFDQLKSTRFDYLLSASGYENRCTYLIDNLDINAGKKIVLAYDDNKDLLYRKKNDKRFADEGFEFIEESSGDTASLTRLLSAICSRTGNRCKVKILVDYSCMSKLWYAAIIKYFISNELPVDNVDLYFSYTSAVFSEPLKADPKALLSAPRGLMKANRNTGKPVALIVGLGYEKYLTKSVIEKIRYDELYLFYSDPAFDSRYADRVMKNNRKLIRMVPPEQLFKYPVEDFRQTDALLTQTTLELRLKYHVAILPVGPKPFTLSSLTLAARYPDIEVWTIESGYSPASYNRNPSGEPMVCKLLLSSDEDTHL